MKHSRQEHTRRKGKECPHCGSDEITGAYYVETGGGEATQNMYCITCGKTWLDYYKLEGYV